MSARRGKPVEPRLGEFELIARLAEIVGVDAADAGLMVGIGDDAAVARRGAGADIYTTDTMVDGVHFEAGRIPWRDLGWKSMAVNLSDIAAMGGTPSYSLVTLGVSAGTPSRGLIEAYKGMAEATKEFGGRVIGGDVVRSPVLFMTVAVIGSATRIDGKVAVLTRSAARPGDRIAVTGTLGAAAGGLRVQAEAAAMGSDRRAKATRTRSTVSGAGAGARSRDVLLRAHYAPVPRVSEGRALLASGVRAAMDISDGLVADLAKLCAASHVHATVHTERLPVRDELKSAYPADYLQLALGGGEDYELLFTAPPEVMSVAIQRAQPAGATVIGEIEPAGEGRGARREEPAARVKVVDANGRRVRVPHAGWDHLQLE